ncbi:endonuclease [Myroides albus]|uniref:Endonuclease n=1 Tax=Myroides albus TaxID=2562892 RepID=A0A6I3LTH8_9FLAO|nr:endonuclease [Myroides albus]MTG99275.1 hypothetical protein [Myroides albus]UVD78856.1 endonuclease [Myroides albus]
MKKFFILPLMVFMSLTYSCSSSDDSITEDTGTENNGGGTKPKPSVVMKDKANYRPIDEAQQQYYKGIDFTLRGEKLKEALHALLVKTHKQLMYTPDLWDACIATDINLDDPNGQTLLAMYGWPKNQEKENKHKRTIDKFAKNNNPKEININRDKKWEREHVFAKSKADPKLVTSRGDKGYSEQGLIAGVDAHNLRAINGQWNEDRGNTIFGEGSGNAGMSNGFWYPGDEWKGDVARMMMYMYVRYGAQCNPRKIAAGNEVATPDYGGTGMMRIFLKWNAEVPVSPNEKLRNKVHGEQNKRYSQGNRNPFIDNPYLANLIWWGGQDQEELVADNIWERIE